MLSVVSMMPEPAGVLKRFADYYAGHGAERIVIYFDGTPPVAAAALGPQVEIVPMDDAFKARNRSGDPRDLIGTQQMIFTAEHRLKRSPWMLVVDADEYLVLPGRRLAEALADLPDHVESVRLPVGEAVWGPGDAMGAEFGQTHFRTPLGRIAAPIVTRIVYGGAARMFSRGLLGHRIGKHAVRTTAEVDIVRVHFSQRAGRPMGDWSTSPRLGMADAFLAHFDAISYARWEEKWTRRHTGEVAAIGMSRPRAAQVLGAAAAIARGAGRDHFEALYGLSDRQARALRRIGGLRRATVF